jgi:hypothetical protein
MKGFWKDYIGLYKMTGYFCKKHWKGVILLNAIIIAVELAYYQIRYNLFDLNFGKKA